ncbi:hypothetical protein, partial [Bacillus cereus]|uniref:hypothetical protein n=1 Tax=Bacillus cereus TaxID=1396 RepID=UPI003D31CF0D
IKDNKKLRGKTAFCIKIYVKLMDVWSYPHQVDRCKKDYAAIEIRYSIGARWLSLFWNRL